MGEYYIAVYLRHDGIEPELVDYDGMVDIYKWYVADFIRKQNPSPNEDPYIGEYNVLLRNAHLLKRYPSETEIFTFLQTDVRFYAVDSRILARGYVDFTLALEPIFWTAFDKAYYRANIIEDDGKLKFDEEFIDLI